MAHTWAVEWGRRLADARTAAGLNQRELAGRLGVHQATVSLWETGSRTPRDEHKAALCCCLDTEWADLFPAPSLEQLRGER